MSVVRDFQSHSSSRPRGLTANSRSSDPPRSPSTRDQPNLDRRGSLLSHVSSRSSRDNHLRFRDLPRSNTITAYHQPPAYQDVFPVAGAEPGIDPNARPEFVPTDVSSMQTDCKINIIDFSQDQASHMVADNHDLAQKLEVQRREDLPCRWISVNGLSWDVIQLLGAKYNLHRLAIEDMTMRNSRTKVDWYSDHAFVILTLQKLVLLHKHWKSDDPEENHDLTEKEPPLPIRRNWWQREKQQKTNSDLPYYLDKNRDGRVDEFVNAHSNSSSHAPMKPTRTLHRYEKNQIPVHTAFMEKHSALASEDLAVSVEQVCIFLLEDNTVISFFEQSAEDVEEPIIKRLAVREEDQILDEGHRQETVLRQSCDASMVLQAIIDGIVDLGIPIRDAYNKARKELQIDAMTNPNIRTSRALHIFGEEIDMLQNLFKPLVALVNALRDHNSDQTSLPPMPTLAPPHEKPNEDAPPLPQERSDQAPSGGLPKVKRNREGAPKFNRQISEYRRSILKRGYNATSVTITPLAHTYFGDVLDHCITMIQALEQMDASAGNISTLIFNTVGAKTNNFMMILAVVTVLFAPLTFISGYFGMNFASGNGLVHPFSFFWIVAIPSLVVFMAIVFATMLWENIRDFFAKRGIKTRRVRRKMARSLQM